MTTPDVYRQAVSLAEHAGITISALCRRAGVSPGTATRWRLGETMPSFRIWQKLTEAAHRGDVKNER